MPQFLLLLHESPTIGGLNRIVALAQVVGSESALAELEGGEIEIAQPLDGYYPFHATRGRLLQDLGRCQEAARSYRRAWELARSAPVREFLERRLRAATALRDSTRGIQASGSFSGRRRSAEATATGSLSRFGARAGVDC